MPAETGVMIYAPFFHRDDHELDFANRFEPDLWLQDRGPDQWPLIPFSGGPAICPGRHLVLLLTSNMLATLIRDHEIELLDGDRLVPGDLPGTLNNFSLRFRIREI
jgi:cytochrome P450